MHALIENCDSVLRMAKKKRKELRAEIEERDEMIEDRESKLLDAKLEIDSLKSTPTISDEIECSKCDAWLAELKELKGKYEARTEECDLARAELVELKDRPALLGACISYPVLHDKLTAALEQTRTLEVALKSPIATPCSSCEVVSLKNIELTSHLDVIYEENDYMHKLFGWLSSREPQLGMMVAKWKRADGRGLGFEKVGECSGESVT